ncbi:uncharacterized protein LOC123314691 [Coccinella septempunctata]|uniref:uncharacterized protein LOC123314691 n=1 Tax=Coccinella septempunctata TaxID=41139 RepID=UPI001D0912BC|nr:uncharacterized protein LOC123314691 [Coccinella septempunctata]
MEMKYLRRVRGVTKMHKIRNEKIGEDVEIEPLMEFIEKRQLSWWEHQHRMNNERPVKKIWESKVQGKKRRGRPERTWDKTLNEIITRRGKTWREAKNMAMNKKTWSRFVH